MKKFLCAALCAMFLLSGMPVYAAEETPMELDFTGREVLVDGALAPENETDQAVYTAHDIVYYEAGHDFTYGEGSTADEHTAEEAAAHTVVHITRPGTYVLRGTLPQGQIAVDLGEDAADDPDARVTLVLDGADITCTVAPAVIFYRVYECDQTGDQGATPDPRQAGAVVEIADGSVNSVNGSHVARIYKSVTLSEDGKTVTDSKKLHKYDGAFYSKMSMRIAGQSEGTGLVNITADNEGLDTEMHLAIEGGNVNITSGNDGINCNEDGVSAITIAGGTVDITVDGSTGEGDGIDSNGYLTLTGGTVRASACGQSGDAGLDAEQAVSLTGATVMAAGNMLDALACDGQCCAVFSFSQRQSGGVTYAIKDSEGETVLEYAPANDFTLLTATSPDLVDGESYSLWADGEMLLTAPAQGGGMGRGLGMGHGPQMPTGQGPQDAPALPDGEAPQAPEDMPALPDGEMPQAPEDMPALPEGEMRQGHGRPDGEMPDPEPEDLSETFTLSPGVNQFSVG